MIGTSSIGYQRHKAIDPNTERGLCLENRAYNTIVGGTTPQERNIISGAQMGIVLSDWPTYQNSIIGNYIGTDITGMKAVPNRTASLYSWSAITASVAAHRARKSDQR